MFDKFIFIWHNINIKQKEVKFMFKITTVKIAKRMPIRHGHTPMVYF